MHSVKRNTPPESLVMKNEKYLNEFDSSTKVSDVWKTLTKNERKDIIAKLNELYLGNCAYCESYIEATGNPHIDHFRPKSIFPKQLFEYDNMNYSCEKCNKNKGDKWDELFFSPSEENPELHIKFEKEAIIPVDERGNKMIDILKLNRDGLIKFRKKKYDSIKRYIDISKEKFENIDTSNIDNLKNCIERFDDAYENYLENSGIDMPYSTMVIQNFSKDIDELLRKKEIISLLIKNMEIKM